MSKPFYGLGVDPGGVNVAFAVVKGRQIGGKTQVKVVRCGVFKNYITNLTTDDATALGAAFINELNTEVRRFGKPSYVVCERFQSRGRIGNVAEQANIIIGLLLAWAAQYKIKVRLITAATWKNRANAQFDLKQAYREVRTTPHELDASLMGVFGAYSLLKAEPPFSELKSRVKRYKLLDCIELSTSGTLRNSRFKRGGAK